MRLMMTEPFEDRLKGYDDRFEVSGELLLDLADGKQAEIDRVIFAWKLCNPDEDLSMQELLLVVTSSPEEIAKVVSVVKGTKVQATKGKKGASKMAWAALRLRKSVMHEVLASATDERIGRLPFFMMGTRRSSVVFDLKNYELVDWEG